MAMSHIQFQSGMIMAEFFQQYGEEKQCEAALEKSRWPDRSEILPAAIPAAGFASGVD